MSDDPLSVFMDEPDPADGDWSEILHSAGDFEAAGESQSSTTLPPASAASTSVESSGTSGSILSKNLRVECSIGRSVGDTVAPSSEKNANPPGPPSSTAPLLSLRDRVRTMNHACVTFGFEKYATTICLFLDLQSLSNSVRSFTEEMRLLATANILSHLAAVSA